MTYSYALLVPPPSLFPLPAPPTLIHRGVIDLAEGDTDSVDLSNTTVAEAIPFPVGDQITWTRDGGAVSSDSRVTYGYPSVMFNAPGVQRSDAGTYQLSATNTRPDGSVIGSDTGNFTLVVYCKPLKFEVTGASLHYSTLVTSLHSSLHQ